MSNFFKKGLQEQKKLEADQKKKEKAKYVSKESISRLYPSKELEKRERLEDEKVIEEKKRDEFVDRVIAIYKQEFQSDNDFRYPSTLFDFWNEVPDKKSQNLDKDDELARNSFVEYFQNKMRLLDEAYKNKNGYYTTEVNALLDLWR